MIVVVVADLWLHRLVRVPRRGRTREGRHHRGAVLCLTAPCGYGSNTASAAGGCSVR
jgi:hypothetical protein